MTASGRPAAHYDIPREQPSGDVHVLSFGVMPLDLGPGEPVPALHVRLTVANGGGKAAWTLDTRDVRLQYRGAPSSSAALDGPGARGLPVVAIPPGESRVVDLFFRLPPSLDDEGDLPRFDVLWSVQADDRRVAERTPFERIRVAPRPSAGVHYGLSFGRAWSYDPLYYRRPIVVRPHPITVERPGSPQHPANPRR